MANTYIRSTREGDYLSDYSPQVYILKSPPVSSTDRTIIANAVYTALGDTYNLGQIDGYQVHEYDVQCYVDDKTSNSGILSRLQSFRQNYGFTADASYIILHSSGKTNPGASDGRTIWTGASDCHVDMTKGSPQKSAPHEVAHALLESDNCSEVSKYVTDPDNEHQLGDTRQGKYTPFNGDNVAGQGTCTGSYTGGNILKYSSCTRQSARNYADHSYGKH